MNYLLYPLNGFYILYLLTGTALFGCSLPFFFLGFKVFKGGRLDEALRNYIYHYGTFITRISWPLLRVKRYGEENIPKCKSCVIVVNHRSTADIFLAPLHTTRNTVVFLRSWPFKIWIFKWFMKGAGYVDIERTPLNEFNKTRGVELAKEGASFLFYPEGHRSRDGKLQRFQSGAFITATELDIPILPVCLTGSESFLPMKKHLIRPATVRAEILPPVLPSSLPKENRALKLRRHVENIFKEHLNEK